MMGFVQAYRNGKLVGNYGSMAEAQAQLALRRAANPVCSSACTGVLLADPFAPIRQPLYDTENIQAGFPDGVLQLQCFQRPAPARIQAERENWIEPDQLSVPDGFAGKLE